MKNTRLLACTLSLTFALLTLSCSQDKTEGERETLSAQQIERAMTREDGWSLTSFEVQIDLGLLGKQRFDPVRDMPDLQCLRDDVVRFNASGTLGMTPQGRDCSQEFESFLENTFQSAKREMEKSAPQEDQVADELDEARDDVADDLAEAKEEFDKVDWESLFEWRVDPQGDTVRLRPYDMDEEERQDFAKSFPRDIAFGVKEASDSLLVLHAVPNLPDSLGGLFGLSPDQLEVKIALKAR